MNSLVSPRTWREHARDYFMRRKKIWDVHQLLRPLVLSVQLLNLMIHSQTFQTNVVTMVQKTIYLYLYYVLVLYRLPLISVRPAFYSASSRQAFSWSPSIWCSPSRSILENQNHHRPDLRNLLSSCQGQPLLPLDSICRWCLADSGLGLCLTDSMTKPVIEFHPCKNFDVDFLCWYHCHCYGSSFLPSKAYLHHLYRPYRLLLCLGHWQFLGSWCSWTIQHLVHCMNLINQSLEEVVSLQNLHPPAVLVSLGHSYSESVMYCWRTHQSHSAKDFDHAKKLSPLVLVLDDLLPLPLIVLKPMRQQLVQATQVHKISFQPHWWCLQNCI